MEIRNLFAGLCLLAVVGETGAQAQDFPISAFYGSFEGGGVSENRDSIHFGVTVRDFDVQIKPEGEGFRVDWATIILGAVTSIIRK